MRMYKKNHFDLYKLVVCIVCLFDAILLLIMAQSYALCFFRYCLCIIQPRLYALKLERNRKFRANVFYAEAPYE